MLLTSCVPGSVLVLQFLLMDVKCVTLRDLKSPRRSCSGGPPKDAGHTEQKVGRNVSQSG